MKSLRKRPIRIAVIGGSQSSPAEEHLAEEIGKRIAQEGFVLVTGGLSGIMKSASRGAKKAKGLTIGILPGYNPAQANPYIDIPIVTGLGHARNIIVVSSADVVVAIGGKFGTLSEIALALKQNKPVLGVNTWALEKQKLRNKKFITVQTPDEVISNILTLINYRKQI